MKRGSDNTDKDAATRQEALAELRAMPASEVFDPAVRAGIYNTTGRLTKRYKAESRSVPPKKG